MVGIEISKRKTISEVLSPLQSVLPPEIFESVNTSMQNVAKLESGQEGQNTIELLPEKQVQVVNKDPETPSKIVRQGKVSVIEIDGSQKSTVDHIGASGVEKAEKDSKDLTDIDKNLSPIKKLDNQSEKFEHPEKSKSPESDQYDTSEMSEDISVSKESKKSVPKIISAIKKISQKVTRKHSKRDKKKESVVEKNSADAISQMKGVAEMLIQSSTESTSFDTVDSQSEKPKIPTKSQSMDIDNSTTDTAQKLSNEEKKRSSSVVDAISAMKDVSEILIKSSNETTGPKDSFSDNQDIKESPKVSDKSHKTQDSEMKSTSVAESEVDQQISEELIQLQKTKQDQIVNITSQLEGAVDPSVLQLLQQGLSQISSDDITKVEKETDESSLHSGAINTEKLVKENSLTETDVNEKHSDKSKYSKNVTQYSTEVETPNTGLLTNVSDQSSQTAVEYDNKSSQSVQLCITKMFK